MCTLSARRCLRQLRLTVGRWGERRLGGSTLDEGDYRKAFARLTPSAGWFHSQYVLLSKVPLLTRLKAGYLTRDTVSFWSRWMLGSACLYRLWLFLILFRLLLTAIEAGWFLLDYSRRYAPAVRLGTTRERSSMMHRSRHDTSLFSFSGRKGACFHGPQHDRMVA